MDVLKQIGLQFRKFFNTYSELHLCPGARIKSIQKLYYKNVVVFLKLKASTLLETLVATIIIILIFMISGLVINNLMKNATDNRHDTITTEMERLGYFALHGKISLPYKQHHQTWEININAENEAGLITISATREGTKQELQKQIYVQD